MGELSRLVEKMKGSSKVSSSNSYLGAYLDRLYPRFAARYLEAKKASADVDALDVLAQMLLQEMGLDKSDTAAARAFLSVLIENDRTPNLSQLVESELVCLRDLLMGYFKGGENINDKGAQVLSMIEKKFGKGDFSQAKILLQIFETNEETRQNNERNLYYEEMIMRLDMTSSRAKPISSNLVQQSIAPDASDDIVLKALAGLCNEGGIRFYLYLRDLEEFNNWRTALEPIHPGVREYLLDYIPVVRWRQMGDLNEPLVAQFGRYMTFEMLRRHVQIKLKMCYFLLLASGCTGHEWYIFAFTSWSRQHFDVDIREVFPMLHRSSVMDGICLQEALDIVTDRFYGPAMNSITIQSSDVERAYRKALKFVLETDINLIPSGHYNFGDFMLDAILPFHYKSPAFSYRLYAMM